ncbi:hypothetical protein [Streptomyces luteireticuli]|uniref:hypothetical protein n=1 Tax=Streptomyces luteireticuli TaxID=173858 RepID=UPI0035591F01
MLRLVDLPVFSGIPRDGRGRPLVVPKAGGRPRALTRATTHIDAIEDKSALAAWSRRMVMVGVSRDPALADRSRDLDETSADGKAALGRLADRAMVVAGAHDRREKGTHLHALSELVDQGVDLPASTSPSDLADMAAYRETVRAFRVRGIEQFVVVDELAVGGTLDRLLSYSGPGPDGRHVDGLFIGDLKTGGSVQYSALKMSAQLAVYSRGELYDHTQFHVDVTDERAMRSWRKADVTATAAAKAYTPLPKVSQEWGIILHLPAGSGECAAYWADLRLGWAAAQLAGEVRRMRGSKGALRRFEVDSTQMIA